MNGEIFTAAASWPDARAIGRCSSPVGDVTRPAARGRHLPVNGSSGRDAQIGRIGRHTTRYRRPGRTGSAHIERFVLGGRYIRLGMGHSKMDMLLVQIPFFVSNEKYYFIFIWKLKCFLQKSFFSLNIPCHCATFTSQSLVEMFTAAIRPHTDT